MGQVKLLRKLGLIKQLGKVVQRNVLTEGTQLEHMQLFRQVGVVKQLGIVEQ